MKDEQHRPLPLKAKASGDSVRLSGEAFCWRFGWERQAGLYVIEGTIISRSRKQLRLEPGLSLKVPRKSGDFFWGGFDVFPAEEKVLYRRGFKGRTSKHLSGGLAQPFATASLISRKQAFILGQPPYELSSYNAAEYRPLDRNTAELIFSQRIVLEPDETISLRFALGLVPVRFGREDNVVQAFYDAYPERFRPFVGRDNPYVWGAHSQYRAWYFKPSREQERRYYATIDWAYTPYKRSGDYFGRAKYWNYTPLAHPFRVGFAQHANGRIFDYRKMTLEQFHAQRKDIFRRDGRDFGYSFYMCVGWCEIGMANQYFQDSLTDDKSVPLVLGPWSTSHDRERRVLPFGNSYAEQVKQDLKDLVDELDMPGFALDCGTPGVYNRRAAAKNPRMPGRAWDEKGLFVDELCATISLIDYIHGLRPEDPLYVWKNGDGPSDYSMIETDLFSPIFKSWMPLNRYNIGQRHAVLHVADGYMFDHTIPNWRNLSRKEFMKEWAKLGDFTVLSDFEYGMSQTHASYTGNPQAVYCLPELLECIRNGWMALMPVEMKPADPVIQRARYGRGGRYDSFLWKSME